MKEVNLKKLYMVQLLILRYFGEEKNIEGSKIYDCQGLLKMEEGQVKLDYFLVMKILFKFYNIFLIQKDNFVYVFLFMQDRG